MKKRAYCMNCKKMVEVIREVDGDEMGLFEYSACCECFNPIQGCYDCDFWKPDSEDTPLYETEGTCRKTGQRVYALDLICEKCEVKK